MPAHRPLSLLLACIPLFCAAADVPPPHGKSGSPDAAQKVQEGNVSQWLEYYRREHGVRPASPPDTDERARKDGTPPPTPAR